ncbi:alkylglycerol monooxygenase-like isoform X3 [Cimex lectularius]|uniref:Alkylglycerol monooxygenase n=1 Tax=Cimex lectularius TaxID=79782 RepID=A0A8I6TG70_CIMLE|nr:alkylglycerol monooxygenase-like isoform X3 [Cimex lectularius]
MCFKDWLSVEKNNVTLQWESQTPKWIFGLGKMFYIVDPELTMYAKPDDVPLMFRQSWPYFITFIFLENLILFLQRKPTARINDGITSLAHGLLQEVGRLVFRGSESVLYIWIYDNLRFCDLPWNSVSTWYLAAIGVDFCYYWVHRASHEVHILWAQHQVHHSSEDFNLTVGLRQSVVQNWCGFVFYLPLALFIPPSIFLTHQQFNLLYQFWIHTETIKTLGPLEWLLNTPKHHRVHHGSTLRCLDKNYGGTLIVWDRIFGTFAEEKEKEEMIYGLVLNQPSYNPLYLQVFYNVHVLNKWKAMDGWANKISAIVKGPSWLPGKPWTGAEEDKINVQSRKKYDVRLPTWCNIYLVLHFIVIVISFQDLAERHVAMSTVSFWVFVTYIVVSLTVIGMMFDNGPNVFVLEMLRCAVLSSMIQRNALYINVPFLKWFFLCSVLFWIIHCLKVLQAKLKTKPFRD